MVIIVTGAIGIGKTTVCEKVIKIAQSQGYSCGGIITYKTQNEDIIIEDVQTGEIKALASISNVYQGPRTAKYFFNPEGIDFGIQAIDRGTASDILLVDELGPLELSGDGFAKVIEQVATGKVKNCIMVIRKKLLSAFLPQLGATTSVFEATINNRNQLPEEIGLVLTREVTANAASRGKREQLL
jgi:nucleoside-triphosphatase THEP1